MPADVAEVDVAVVADEAPLAHRPEQRAVRRERLHPGLLQRPQHLLHRVQQRGDLLVVTGVEGLGEPVGLVDAERPARGVDDGDPVVPVPRSTPRRAARGPRRARPPRAGCCRPGTCAAAGATRRHRRPTLSRRVQNDQIRRPSKSTSSTVSSADSTRTPSSSTASTRTAGPSGIRLSPRRTRWPASGPRRSRPRRCGTGRCPAPRPAGRPARCRARCRARSSPGRRPRRGA